MRYEMLCRIYNDKGAIIGEWSILNANPKIDMLLSALIENEPDTVRVSFDIAISRER